MTAVILAMINYIETRLDSWSRRDAEINKEEGERNEKKVIESYEKQYRKLDTTYKNIFLALESHKNQQLNALRTLLDKQKDLIKRARIELENILAAEDSISPTEAIA